jgi:mono/diheme cytochrome c family protein
MKILSLAILSAVVFIGCTDRTKTNVELIQDMFVSPAIKAQDHDPLNPYGLANGLPPEGTEPIGFEPYRYWGKLETDIPRVTNPVQMNNEDWIEAKRQFTIYCAVCHGENGNGKGYFVDKMLLPPPSLLSDKVRAYADSQIFHMITVGRGMMGSYANQIIESEKRWQVVHYVRKLQKDSK